jgi:Sec-independent protein translocase protein TatA
VISAAIVAVVVMLVLAAVAGNLPELVRKTRKTLSPSARKQLRSERHRELTARLEREDAEAPDGLTTTIADIDRQLGNSSGKDTP